MGLINAWKVEHIKIHVIIYHNTLISNNTDNIFYYTCSGADKASAHPKARESPLVR
jgi:hypothetical protein